MSIAEQNEATILGRNEQENRILRNIAEDQARQNEHEDIISYPEMLPHLVEDKRLFCSNKFDYSGAQKLTDGQGGYMFRIKHKNLGTCTIKRYYKGTHAGVAVRELEILRLLRGVHTLKLLGAYYDNTLTLVMESYSYCVSSVLGRLPLTYVVQMAADIGGALEYIHNKDIIHGDIRPDNIVVQKERFLLTQFSVAIKRSDANCLTKQTTPKDYYYLDLNAITKNQYSFQTDQWGLMCSMFELEKNKHYLENKKGYPKKNLLIEILTTGLELNNGELVTVDSLLERSFVFPLLKILKSGTTARSFVSSQELKRQRNKYQNAKLCKLSELATRPNPKTVIEAVISDEDLLRHACNAKYYFEQDGLNEIQDLMDKTSRGVTIPKHPMNIHARSQTPDKIASNSPLQKCASPIRPSSVAAQPVAPDNATPLAKNLSRKAKKPRRLEDARTGHHFVCWICVKYKTVYLKKIQKHSLRCADKNIRRK